MAKTTNIQKIADNIIKINVSKRTQLNSFLAKKPATFIFVSNNVLYNSKPVERIFKLERNDFLDSKQVDLITLGTNDTNLSSDENKKAIFEYNLRNTIRTFFLEGGKELYLFSKGTDTSSGTPFNYKLPADINFMICINLYSSNSDITQVNDNNADRDIIYIRGILDSSVNKENTNTFILEVDNKGLTKETKEKSVFHYLAHPAAYLSNLDLNHPVRDYCYSSTKTIVPSVDQEVEITENQEWVKNYIINIGGKGIAVGGELLNGENMVNTFTLWLLKKQLQETLINILINKPTRGVISSLLQNELGKQLNNFYDIGAIESFINRDVDKTIDYNGQTFMILQNGEFVEKGYKLHIVSVLDSSDEDIKNHKMTPITIILNQQNQIRFIELNMEVN